MSDSTFPTSTKIQCPHCQKALHWSEENDYRPFCSQRCQQIDFGNWANEDYTIPSEDSPSSDDQADHS